MIPACVGTREQLKRAEVRIPISATGTRYIYYNVSLSCDVIGVECAVAMKNAYTLGVTLAIGLSERREGVGCKEHYNSQAALFAQSIREMSRFLKLVGGHDDNIIWATGDLYFTVFGGRTRKVGILPRCRSQAPLLIGLVLSLHLALAALQARPLEPHSRRVRAVLSPNILLHTFLCHSVPRMK